MQDTLKRTMNIIIVAGPKTCFNCYCKQQRSRVARF